MGRRRGRGLRAAKVWLVLFFIAAVFGIRERLGLRPENIGSDLNNFGETWLSYASWLFGVALFFFILSRFKGGNEDTDDRPDSGGRAE